MATVFLDDCSRPPIEVWKGVDAAALSRIIRKGSDRGGYYREFTVIDGDVAKRWVSPTSFDGYSGERTEVGRNSLTYAPFLYREGNRATTVMRYRLPRGYPIDARLYQSVMQQKQTGPSNYSPAIGMNAQRGGWELLHTGLDGTTERLWTTPAKLAAWTDIIIEGIYSSDPAKGEISLQVGGVRSPVFKTNTLLFAPAHLRAGCYHHVDLTTTKVHIGPTRVDIN